MPRCFGFAKFSRLRSRGFLESVLKPPHPELAVGVLGHDDASAERTAGRDDEVDAYNVGNLACKVA